MRSWLWILLALCVCLASGDRMHFKMKWKEKRTLKMPELQIKGGMSDGFYLISIGVGTPPQPIQVALDTGSSTFAFVSEGCVVEETGAKCVSNHTFDPSLSSTAVVETCSHLTNCTSCSKSNTCSVTLSYEDGTQVKGTMLRDIVSFSNCSSPVFFAAITSDKLGDFSSNETDGIMGLSYPLEGNLPSFLSEITNNLQIRDIFSICFGYQGGSFILGGIEETYHTGGILYTPIIKKGYYSVKMLALKISDYEDSYLVDTSAFDAFVDSGTTMMIVPYVVYNQTVTKLKKLCDYDSVLDKFLCQGQNIFNTNRCLSFDSVLFSKLPNLLIRFAGEKPGSVFELILRPKDYLRYVASTERGFDYCGRFGITFLEGFNSIILGDVFMKVFYTVFDLENGRLGFGYSKNCGGEIHPVSNAGNLSLGIGLSFAIVAVGLVSMILIVYCKTRSERAQRYRPIVLQRL